MSKEDLLKAMLELTKTENYCYQKYKLPPNSSCIIKEENVVGKNLLEGTYFDGNGIPKMIGITKAEYLEYKKLQQENKRLKIQVSAREEVANKYKKVIDEVRKFIEDWLFDAGGNVASMTYEDINELLQILDKIIGDDK